MAETRALLAAAAALCSTDDVHVLGTQPQKLLPVMSTSVRPVMLPHEDGSEPLNALLERSMEISEVVLQLGRPRHALVLLIFT